MRTRSPARPPSQAPGSVRLIGGRFKRSRLAVPDLPGLRPTPDRVRETLFNWLGQDLSGWAVLDACAGSGALGLEAASRGASRVVLVENHPVLVRHLRGEIQRLGVEGAEVLAGDARARMAQAPAASVDLVFLDPPYQVPWYPELLAQAARLVRPTGWIYLEADHLWAETDLLTWGLRLHRQLQAGQVFAHLLQRKTGDVRPETPGP